jgi:hypothetical protein
MGGGMNAGAVDSMGAEAVRVGADAVTDSAITAESTEPAIVAESAEAVEAVERKVFTPAEPTPAVSLPARVPPQNTLVSRTPQTVAQDTAAYAFLLGKKVARDIYGENGRLVAKENALVTDDIIRAAKQGGKLVQLALYAD